MRLERLDEGKDVEMTRKELVMSGVFGQKDTPNLVSWDDLQLLGGEATVKVFVYEEEPTVAIDAFEYGEREDIETGWISDPGTYGSDREAVKDVSRIIRELDKEQDFSNLSKVAKRHGLTKVF